MSGEYTRMVNEIRSLLHQINDKLDDKINRTKEDNLRLITRRMGKDIDTREYDKIPVLDERLGIEEIKMGIFTISMEEQEEIMRQIFEECSKIRAVAQHEYSHDTSNVHANFDRLAGYLHIDPKKVLFTYMYKHIDGIAAYVNGFESQREGVKNRINDVIVYLVLLRGLFERDNARMGKDKLS